MQDQTIPSMSDQIQQQNNSNQDFSQVDNFEQQQIVDVDPVDVQLQNLMGRIQNIRDNRGPPLRNNFNFQINLARANQGLQENSCNQCIDFVFFWYIVYTYFFNKINAVRFVWTWIITRIVGPCCPIIKYIGNIGLLCWAAYLYIFSESPPEINLFFYLHIFDIILVGCLMCCCQVSLILLCCLQFWALFVKIKVKFDKFLRFRKNISTIKAICQYKYGQTNQKTQNSVTCPICFIVEGDYCETSCNHSFHCQCLETWLKTNISCPMCRKKLY